jgi:CubicO group peptidase (beta-lactamase class C family)
MTARIIFSLFAFVASAMSQPTEKSVDDLFKNFSPADAPGAVVMVIKDGKTAFAKAYGAANIEAHTACSTNTNFRLASVSKQFTAMSILILVERGKLQLDQSITRFFPEFPEYGKPITVRHLLTHTSGILDYEDLIPPGTTIPLSDENVLLLLRQQNKTNFSPGTKFQYSNSGYALLSLIVEAASGSTFPEFLHQNIFQPLGMTNTLAYKPGLAVVPNRSYGYTKKADGYEGSDQSLTSAVLGDGGIYSSVVDLFKWDQALYTEKLVSRKTLEQIFTGSSRNSDMKDSAYGFGWYIGQERGVKHIWHYGSTCGFSTQIHRFPEKNFSLIVLTNRRDAGLTDITKKLIELFW